MQHRVLLRCFLAAQCFRAVGVITSSESMLDSVRWRACSDVACLAAR